MNMDVKTRKIVQKLLELGKKYGNGSPSNYRIESHHRLSCTLADGTNREITVVIREEDISIFFRPNPPQWYEGDVKLDDVLKEIERSFDSPN